MKAGSISLTAKLSSTSKKEILASGSSGGGVVGRLARRVLILAATESTAVPKPSATASAMSALERPWAWEAPRSAERSAKKKSWRICGAGGVT
jgi:hypothetical protein